MHQQQHPVHRDLYADDTQPADTTLPTGHEKKRPPTTSYWQYFRFSFIQVMEIVVIMKPQEWEKKSKSS